MTLDELLPIVEHHSTRLNHYYLGAEHLCLALLTISEGYTPAILLQHGIDGNDFQYKIEQYLGKTPPKRYWQGFRTTPRYEQILQHAQQASLTTKEPTERDILLALFEDGDSIPIRVLRNYHINTDSIRDSIKKWIHTPDYTPPALTIDGKAPLTRLQQQLLQRIFQEEVSVYTLEETECLVVKKQDLQYIVRFDLPKVVLSEINRIQNYTLKLTNIQYAIENQLAIIAYFIPTANPPIKTAWEQFQTISLDRIVSTTQQLTKLPHFSEAYRFPIWHEYDFLLPPALVVRQQKLNAKSLLRPLKSWAQENVFKKGMSVILEDFTVQSISEHRETALLSADFGDAAINLSSRIIVTEINNLDRFTSGQMVQQFTAEIQETRYERLIRDLELLDPNFSIHDDTLDTPYGTLRNPIHNLTTLLNYEVTAPLIPIYGNQTLENIILDNHDHFWRINFGEIRFGHALFDQITLEASLLHQAMARMPDDWISVWDVANLFTKLNRNLSLDGTEDLSFFAPFPQFLELRRVIESAKLDWDSYFLGLIMVYLSQITDHQRPIKNRRAAFALAAVTTQSFFDLIDSPK